MKLSILIPSIAGREDELFNLLKAVEGYMRRIMIQDLFAFHQVVMPESFRIDDKRIWGMRYQCGVEWLVCKDKKEITIGEKRELLYQKATGDYSWQIDDDDSISDNAVELILEAIENNPDCITFQEHCIINGKTFSSNHSLKYEDWGEKQDGFDYVRTPFMKSVIKTEIARSVPIPHIRYGEDHEWAKAIKPHLKTEVHIPEYIYYYQHESKPEDHNERYGIK